MTEYFCDCFRKWNEDEGAWPKWVEIAGSKIGHIYVQCFEHGGRWVKI